MKNPLVVALLPGLLLSSACSQHTGRPAPDLAGALAFERPAQAEPIITRQPDATFLDPITKRPVHWEALHTFNPAAIVRNGKVFVLYRAEDDSGSLGIGLHTSRLGLAESSDGLHFTTRPEPVSIPRPMRSSRASGRAGWRIRGSSRRLTGLTC